MSGLFGMDILVKVGFDKMVPADEKELVRDVLIDAVVEGGVV